MVKLEIILSHICTHFSLCSLVALVRLGAAWSWMLVQHLSQPFWYPTLVQLMTPALVLEELLTKGNVGLLTLQNQVIQVLVPKEETSKSRCSCSTLPFSFGIIFNKANASNISYISTTKCDVVLIPELFPGSALPSTLPAAFQLALHVCLEIPLPRFPPALPLDSLIQSVC